MRARTRIIGIMVIAPGDLPACKHARHVLVSWRFRTSTWQVEVEIVRCVAGTPLTGTWNAVWQTCSSVVGHSCAVTVGLQMLPMDLRACRV